MDMNITLDGANLQIGAETGKAVSFQPQADAPQPLGYGYAVAFSDGSQKQGAYAGHGKSMEDLAQEAQATQVMLQSQCTAIMGNSITEKDINELREEGYCPADMDPEDVLNTVEHIKATLAEAGVVIAGYNDDLDLETLERLTGSKGLALQVQKNFHENDIPVTEKNVQAAMEAVKTAENLPEVGEGTAKYLVENRMEPTVENLYLASYSGSGDGSRQGYGYYDQNGMGYYAKRAEEYDWDALRDQMEGFIKEAQLPVNDETMGQARFLVEKGIPLTAENILRMQAIGQIPSPMDAKNVISSVAAAIADGKEAMKANLSVQDSILLKAVRVKMETDEITDRELARVIASGEPLTIKNLTEMSKISEEAENGVADTDAAFLSAKRLLEETRLAMTVEANISLLKRGYAIDTTELSQLVEDLKQAEAEINRVRFAAEDTEQANERAAVYERTESIIKAAPEYPIALAGRLLLEEKDLTLSETAAEGERLQKQYEAAGERYETLMTKPRADLGDSIRKAFRNIDDILKDLGLEPTELNRRAVRILSYNEMALTKEQIAEVKDADLLLQRTVEKLTPAATMQLIREGKNPLSMTLHELEEYLTRLGLEDGAQQEKYSRFLYQMEQSGKITEEEKKSFIGIYRLFRQVEKSDGAVIGSILNSDQELTVSGLLTALRSRKKSGMDVRISDENGALAANKATDSKDKIDEQINAAYRTYEHRLASEVFDKLDPVSLAEFKENEPEQSLMDMPVEELHSRLVNVSQENKEESEKLNREYDRQQLQEIRKAADIDDETVKELLDGRQPVSVHMLLAAQELFGRRSSVFFKLTDESDRVLREAAIESNNASPVDGDPQKDSENELAAAEDGQQAADAAKAWEDALNSLPEHFTDEDQAKEAYLEMIGAAEELLAVQEARPEIGYAQLSDIHRMAGQLKLAGALSKEEHYEIPLRTQDGLTALRLTIKHDGEHPGSVSVVMGSDENRVQAEFTADGNRIFGRILCEEESGIEKMQKIADLFGRQLPEQFAEAIVHVESKDADLASKAGKGYKNKNIMTDVSEKEGAGEKPRISSSALYETAKAFIGAVQNSGQERNG